MRAPTADVTVFIAALDVRDERLRALEAVLSPEERERSAAMKIDRVRRRFIAGRGIAREVIAREANVEPRSLRFGTGPRGKPFLEAPRSTPAIEINVSHSEDILLVAVARGRAVGVDIEVRRPDVEVEALASRFFSSREMDALLALDPAEQLPAFFACWVRKEAYVKARGEGMGIPLDRFDVALTPGDAPALLADRGDPCAPREWTLVDLSVSPRAAAALVLETRDGSTPDVKLTRIESS